jgi:O-antigen ligase
MIDMTTGTWVILILSVLVGHVALFILARYFNIVVMLGTTFMVLAFLGFASARGDVTSIRLARIYCGVVAILLGLRALHLPEIRAAGLLYFTFIVLYVLSSLWSQAPVDALARKGVYALPMVLGLLLAYAIRDRHDFEGAIRILTIPGIIFAALFFAHLASGSTNQRLSVIGTNPNVAGALCASMLILCAYGALYGSSKPWKVLAYVTGTLLAMAILYTGSRGAAGYAIIGCSALILPLVRRPLAVTVLAIAVLGTGWFVQGKLDTKSTERMTEVSLTGRDSLWVNGLSHVKESPLFGVGWVPTAKASAGIKGSRNWHSMWVQTAVDTGIVGVLLLLFALSVTSLYALRSWRTLIATESDLVPLFLAGALFGGALAHGIVESEAVIGSAIPSLILPFSIVLLERLPIILQAESPWGEVLTEESFEDQEAYADYEGGPEAAGEYAEGAY